MPVAGGGFFPGSRGKKRAVLIGITYAGMRRRGSQLMRGPVNDVKCMRYLLCERFGFPNDCVLILTGEPPTATLSPHLARRPAMVD